MVTGGVVAPVECGPRDWTSHVVGRCETAVAGCERPRPIRLATLARDGTAGEGSRGPPIDDRGKAVLPAFDLHDHRAHTALDHNGYCRGSGFGSGRPRMSRPETR